VGHFGLVPVTFIVFPFLTQVIVFFLLEAILVIGELLGVGELDERLGDGEAEGVGEAEGITISATLIEGDADGDADGVAEAVAVAEGVAAATTPVGNKLMSYLTLPNPSRTFFGKESGSGVSERCFITERTSGWKLGNIWDAPSAVTPARRVRISVRRLR
jgi:hypothetical protein